MKEYIKPEMEVEEFDVEDIITQSPVGEGETPVYEKVEKDDGNFFSN